MLGAPTEVVARGTEAPSGVNGQVSALLGYASGARGIVHTSILASTPVLLVIAGSEATLTISDGFSLPGPFTVLRNDGERLEYTEPLIGYDGLAYQAADVARRITAGELETPYRPLARVHRHDGADRRDPPPDRRGLGRGTLTDATAERI